MFNYLKNIFKKPKQGGQPMNTIQYNNTTHDAAIKIQRESILKLLLRHGVDVIISEANKMFSDISHQKHLSSRIIDSGIYASLIERISQVYSKAPVRTFHISDNNGKNTQLVHELDPDMQADAASYTVDTDLLSKLESLYNPQIESQLQMAEVITNALSTSFYKIVRVGDQYTLSFCLPDVYDFVGDTVLNTRIGCISEKRVDIDKKTSNWEYCVHSDKKGNRLDRPTVYIDNKPTKVGSDGLELWPQPVEAQELEAQRIGQVNWDTTREFHSGDSVAPFVCFRSKHSLNGIYGSPDLATADSAIQLEIIKAGTQLAKDCSASPLRFIVDAPNDKAQHVSLSCTRVDSIKSAVIGGSASAETIKPEIKQLSNDAKLNERLDVEAERMKCLYEKHGIPYDNGSGQRQSAESKSQDRYAYNQIIAKQAPIWRQNEEQLFKCLVSCYNCDHPDDKIPYTVSLSVDFANIKQTSEEEKLRAEVDSYKLSNNTTNPVDIILRDNPDLSLEQAEAKFEKNKKINGTGSMDIFEKQNDSEQELMEFEEEGADDE